MADTIKATPRNQTLGALVNAYDKTLGPLLNKYEVLPQIPLIGGMTLGDLGANSIRNVANEMSYGNYQPVRNARNIQTMTIDPDTLDVATMLPLGGVAAKIGKPLAKAVGRGAAEKMAQHVDSLGLNQYIIPPEGNLNFTTRLDEQIKGPETQTVYDLLKQVQGKPGVTKEGLKQIAAKYPDSAAKVTKQEFAESIPASQYGKVDLEADFDDMYENYFNEAMENLDPVTTYYNLGLPQRLHLDFDRVVSNEINFSDLDPETQELFRERFGLPNEVSDHVAYSRLGDIYMDQQQEELTDYARQAAENAGDASSYAYKSFQRLVPKDDPGYFEFGVTHPDQTGQYKHYSGTTMPEGLIGHVRGSLVERPTVIEGGIEVPPNSYVIEEIQSDAQKGAEQTGPLHQVHGTLFKSAVQDALEKGADRIYLPTSYPISRVRHKHPEDYASIYDKAVIKEGLEPLSKIPGVEIKPIFKQLESEHFFQDHPDYHQIKLSPEAREHILTGPGQSIPGYAAGGLVASDYDDEQIDKMSDEIFNFAKGGRATVQPRENEYVTKAARYGRKGQYQMAELAGMKPEVKFATEIPEYYFPANEQHNARGDAMRHMLLQAQLMQKYGETPAKVIGWLHENLSGPQSDAEEAMDVYNDRLGREIGRVATDKADMAYRAMQAIEKQQARTLTKEQMGEGYARGGLVYNDEEINNLANQLLGV